MSCTSVVSLLRCIVAKLEFSNRPVKSLVFRIFGNTVLFRTDCKLFCRKFESYLHAVININIPTKYASAAS